MPLRQGALVREFGDAQTTLGTIASISRTGDSLSGRYERLKKACEVTDQPEISRFPGTVPTFCTFTTFSLSMSKSPSIKA